MENRGQDLRYEQLYTDMMAHALQIHERNKNRIRWGVISLVLLPVVLGVIRWLTDSDKALFLLIWVICMFLLCAYLIGVEYLDHRIQNMLREMTDREQSFDRLYPEAEEVADQIKGRLAHRQAVRRSFLIRAGILPDPEEAPADPADFAGEEQEGGPGCEI